MILDEDNNATDSDVAVSYPDREWTAEEYQYELKCIREGKGIWTEDELHRQIAR